MALSNFRDTAPKEGKSRKARLAATQTVFAGALIVTDTATGYDKVAVTGTGLVARGVARANASSVGFANGAVEIEVEPGCHRFYNSSAADAITVAERGQPCFIVDDCTVAKTDGSGTRSVAGTIVDVDTHGVYVEIAAVNGTSLASEIAARGAISTDLASTANGKGASLVGIEDSAGLYTGTNLETALAEKLTGLRVANVADANVVGGVPVVHRIDVADGATGDVDVTLTHKTMVLDVHVIKTTAAGGASDTITVKNGATAITDAMSINVADKAIVRAGSIDDAQNTIAAAGTLRVTRTKASANNVACTVVVTGIRVA